MLALRVIYLNFWVDHPDDFENVFHQHFTIIKATYSMPGKMGKERVTVKALLDGHVLDVQCFFFKMTMVTNNEIVMKGIVL
jgi:ribosomal protein L3